MFNQFTFSLIFSDYFQNFIFLSSNNILQEKPIQIYKNLNFGKFDVMKVSRILKQPIRVIILFYKKYIRFTNSRLKFISLHIMATNKPK